MANVTREVTHKAAWTAQRQRTSRVETKTLTEDEVHQQEWYERNTSGVLELFR
jgi:hypothetical protein